MHRFGQYATIIVALLLLAGTITAYQLIRSIDELLNTLYGQLFIGKLLLSMGVLLIAAIHKWRLIPKLMDGNNTRYRLACSIRYEIIIMVFILITTAIITTILGPSHLM